MKKGNYLNLILRSNKSVFSFTDIALLWQDSSQAARVRLNYYLKKGYLYKPCKGFYAKDEDYSYLELGNKIYTPSYISFETVLIEAGIIFQTSSKICLASYLSREIQVSKQAYIFHKIKDNVLTSPEGLELRDNYFVASFERAFLDTLYIYKNYYFDNLEVLNWNKVKEMVPIYNNKRLEREVKNYLSKYGF